MLTKPVAEMQLADGYVRVFVPRPTVICAEYEGHITNKASEIFLPIFRDALDQYGRYVHFGDTTKVKSYDPAFKDFWFKYYKNNRQSVDGIHYLVRSLSARLGMQVFKLAMGSDFVHIYRNPVEYRKRMQAAIDAADL